MSSAARIPRLIRCMHTGGRQVPHPPQANAGSTSPTPHSSDLHTPPPPSDIPVTTPNPQNDSSPVSLSIPKYTSRHRIDTPGMDDSPKWNRNGRRIMVRPARKIPVQLPSGYPEPPTYPPPKEYFKSLEPPSEQTEEWVDKKQPLHPLWKFFHIDIGAKSKLPDDEYTKTEMPIEVGAIESMRSPAIIENTRSWKTSELRMKSFADLHTLWYVLLRERNVLATQIDERRRLGINNILEPRWMSSRVSKCRASMQAIKQVLNERRLAVIATLAPLTPPRERLPEFADPTNVQGALWSGSRDYPDPAIRPKRPRSINKRNGQKQKRTRAATIGDEEVQEAEVVSRDEGFGGGEEASKFVNETEVDEAGRVKKVE